MSNSMPVHKLINKYKQPELFPIVFKPHKDLEHPLVLINGRYDVFAQQDNKIGFKSQKSVSLKFGISIRKGISFIKK